MESGGHIGKLSTMVLVPLVVDAVNIPVIASGGIADGRGVAASFMLGASGVQVGTRFLVASECTVHENYKKKILDAKDIDTIVTGYSTGHPVRGLRNPFAQAFTQLEKQGASVEEIEAFGSGALRKSAKQGDMENGAIMAGQVAAMVKKEQSAKEIIEEMIDDCKRIIKDTDSLDVF
jgi:enoyl-[acyl-carrier protein] reductase II